jgi:HSP20 family protein
MFRKEKLMLMRFDPFRELDRMASTTLGRQWPSMPSMLAMDAYRHGDEFVVHFDLPGARPDSIDLSVEKNVLTVKAARGWTKSDEDEVVVSERPQGEFTRQLFLGDGLAPDAIKASYDNGVLTVTIPVAEQAKPRRVDIQGSGSPAKAVDAGSTERTQTTSAA